MKGLCLVLISLTGCSLLRPQIPMSVFLSPCFDEYRVHRALVLPFFENGNIENHDITAIFIEALQSAQRFEVLSVPDKRVSKLNSEIFSHQDAVPAQAIAKLAQDFNVQAIIRGRITACSALPNTLGLKVDLISTYNGAILWSVDALFYDRYFCSNSYRAIEETLVTLSPHQFARTACYQFAMTLRK